MRKDSQPHHHHKQGCLSYKTLRRRVNDADKQISRAAKEIYRLQCYQAAVESAPLGERFLYMLTGNAERIMHD